MSDFPPSSVGANLTNAAALPQAPVAPVIEEMQGRKGLDLAVIKKGAKDFLEFMDASKEVFYAYLYHRTGSEKVARTLLSEIYVDTLSRAMSLWWFGTLGLKLLLDHADHAVTEQSLGEADLDKVYVPSLVWLTDTERVSAATLHDALWTLPAPAQRLLILSLFVGLSDARIAEVFSISANDVTSQLVTAKELLLTRWQPTPELATKLQSLVFVPSLDLQSETNLRFNMVEKYNSLRLRKYQWVILAGLFAVMSNVIVASVLAFAVITEPPTSLRGTRTQVASLDAVLINRELQLADAKRSVAASFREAQRVAAFDVSRDFTSLGLASALEALKSQQDQESEVNRLQKLMQRARTAMAPILIPHLQLAMQEVRAILAAGPQSQTVR